MSLKKNWLQVVTVILNATCKVQLQTKEIFSSYNVQSAFRHKISELVKLCTVKLKRVRFFLALFYLPIIINACATYICLKVKISEQHSAFSPTYCQFLDHYWTNKCLNHTSPVL